MRSVVLMIVVGVFLMAAPDVAAADNYKVTVSHESNNMYHVVGTDFYVVTSMCGEYGYSEPAILVWEYKGSFNNKLVFYDSHMNTSCRVKKVFQEVTLN